MQSAALLVGEVITFVVNNQIDNHPLRQGCRLVQNEPAVLDPRSKRAHGATLRVSRALGKRSRGAPKSVDLAEPRDDVVPTGWRKGRQPSQRQIRVNPAGKSAPPHRPHRFALPAAGHLPDYSGATSHVRSHARTPWPKTARTTATARPLARRRRRRAATARSASVPTASCG